MVIYFHWQKRIKHHQLWNESQSNLCNPALLQKLFRGLFLASWRGSWLGSVIQQQTIQFLPVAATIRRVYYLAIVLNSTPVANCSLAGQYTSCTSQYGNLHVFSVVRDVYVMDFIRLYDHMLGPPYVWFHFDFGKWHEKPDGYTQHAGMLQTCDTIDVRWFIFVFQTCADRNPWYISLALGCGSGSFRYINGVSLIGGRWYIITQLAVYTTYIPLLYCQLGDYISPIPPTKGTRNCYWVYPQPP